MASNPAAPAAAFLIANFFLSYFFLTPRGYRMLLGLATNRNPRQDMANFSEKMVAEGRITREQVDRLGRWEAAQQNAVENFPLFVAAILFALIGNQNTTTIVGFGIGYTMARIFYGIAYIMTDNEMWSYARSILWWAGNVLCFWVIIAGAKGAGELRRA
ncbi:hypothetical protein BP5796_02811 [Coleophoma crateriformis]|uniref:MAPEG family protein n=1 Tax=Coleophoma crateriformis TaxID=565419 RepID=A0A3D8SZC3_9HELO|nr:hypothetical protein BP5796_02811 [Coleophoma crateriformis]